jgi:predicted RNA-binding Zn-ribbon protein involved in translation (DUF1610 family)
MQEAVSLTCPNCGSKLRIAEHVVRFACAGCGAGLILEREGGIVFLTLV